MAGYVPDRDSVIELLLSVLERSPGPAPHVVELGSGPGRPAVAICDRWPTAIVTAVRNRSAAPCTTSTTALI